MSSVAKLRFDGFEADVKAGELRRDGSRLRLQLQPFQVLVALLERPKEVVTREELRQRLWPEDTFVDFDHGLNTAMVKLRDVLGDSASNPKYIETIAKRGYRFLREVETISPPETRTGTVKAPPAVAAPPPSTAGSGAVSPSTEEGELPRASRATSRTLFILSQVMYLSFYVSALFNLDKLMHAAGVAWRGAATIAFVVYLVTALVGIAVRLYLISATALDYHLLGQKYRLLFPALLVLDLLWALAPLLLTERIGLGLALASCAALIYSPFAQRVLVKMMDRTSN